MKSKDKNGACDFPNSYLHKMCILYPKNTESYCASKAILPI